MMDEEKIEEAALECGDSFFEDQANVARLAFKDGINWYLDNLWHDARKEKQPQGVCDNNAVLVVGLRNGRVSYKYLWADMEDLWLDLEALLATPAKVYDRVLWAYIRDLVPGVKPKGL